MNSSDTPNKRKRAEAKERGLDDDERALVEYQWRTEHPRLEGQPVDGPYYANQHNLLQGSFPSPLALPSDSLFSIGNYLTNPTAASLRSLPLPTCTRSESTTFNSPFLSPALSSQLGSSRDQSISDPTRLLAQQGILSGQVQAQGHGQAQSQGLTQLQVQAHLQSQSQVQAQLQAQSQAQAQLHAQLEQTQARTELKAEVQAQRQAQAQATTFHQPQRGLLLQPPIRFANIYGSSHQASQIPNLSVALTPGTNTIQQLFTQKGTSSTIEDNETSLSAISMGAAVAPVGAPIPRNDLTGRPPVVLYMPCDDAIISRYQCLARQQMELFEAQEIDVEAGAQGRNRGIVLGQVGIRCRHCSHLYPRRRTKSSTFYPSTLKSIYQTAQNMANTHLTHTCQYIPQSIRDELLKLSQDKKTSAGGGKEYWSDGARILGVYEAESYLRFSHHNGYPGSRRSFDATKGTRLR